MINVTFLMKILQGNIHSESLLNRIGMNVPNRCTRNFELLQIQYYRTNYANNDPLRRLCIQFNKLYHIIDLSENTDCLKRKITLHLNSPYTHKNI